MTRARDKLTPDSIERPYPFTGEHSSRAPALYLIPAATRREICKHPKCAAALYIVPTVPGKTMPVACAPTVKLADGTVVLTGAFAPWRDVAAAGNRDLDGLGYSHFIDCPGAEAFRRGAPK